MIKVNKVKLQTVEHFDPEGNSLGFLNVIESTDLRAQIIDHKADGYSLEYNGEKFLIDSDGYIKHNPQSLYDQFDKALNRLLNARNGRSLI